jgi:hypothetical protein
MASREGIRRVVALAALSLAVVSSSIVVSESGGASIKAGLEPKASRQLR